jgi:hypothetical protein
VSRTPGVSHHSILCLMQHYTVDRLLLRVLEACHGDVQELWEPEYIIYWLSLALVVTSICIRYIFVLIAKHVGLVSDILYLSNTIPLAK